MIYETHPVACIFPMMDDASFNKLKDDIATNGVERWGLLYEGKILDGRNRYRACQELGIEMSWSEVEQEDMATFDPLQYVLTHNLHRRHLKQSQRAVIAAKMATLKNGKRPSQNCEATRDEAASLLSVSPRSVDAAKHVLEHGCKPLIEAVESCQITVSMAEKLCKAEPDKRKQAQLVKEGKKAIQEFLMPMPDANASDAPGGQDDDDDAYDYPIVKAFSVADYRMNTLKKIFDTLEPYEAAIVRDWVAERLN